MLGLHLIRVIDPGKKARGARSYLPQKNSVAYALLISLYRCGQTFDAFKFLICINGSSSFWYLTPFSLSLLLESINVSVLIANYIISRKQFSFSS